MRALLLTVLILVPFSASAEYVDVIEATLNDGCTVAEYAAMAADFNTQWGEKNGYIAEILSPIQSDNLVSVFWVGRTANAAAFGAAWDKWRAELADSKSIPSKLNVRLTKCSTNGARRGYDTN